MVRGTPTGRVQVNAVDGETQKQTDPVIIRKTPIMWGIPCDEVMFSKFFTQFNKNAGVMPWDAFAIAESTYLPKARNIIHNAFLESNVNYLAMIDSDVLFPPYAFNRMIAHKLPIVSGWYKNKKGDPYPIVYDFGVEGEKEITWKHRKEAGTGLEQVDGFGAGCVLMTRHAAELLGKDPYDMLKSGEDLTMCYKLRQLGIPLHVDWEVSCAHLGLQWV
jgi:hypothetical protein